MISESTYVEAIDKVIARPLDMLRVKGKKKPTSVYELMAKTGELDQKGQNLLELSTSGVEAYRKRDFQTAFSNFEKALTIFPDDGPSKVYLERCSQYLITPPANDWDGVFTMTTK